MTDDRSETAEQGGIAGRPARRPRVRPRLVGFVALVGVLAVLVSMTLVPDLLFLYQTSRSTPVYEPPVLAGQMLTGCSGGFYARHGDQPAMTWSAHCADPGMVVTFGDAGVLGVTGQRASLADCPAGRFCAPSDVMPLILEPTRVPWGHLNLVDLTRGGYRVIAPGTRPLACGDIHVGESVEVGGRGWYRSGKVVQIERYEFASDTVFPCMVITDIGAGVGDSGGAVFVDGQPAGITSREIDGQLAFTPLAEGLDAMGFTLCSDPDCGLAPPQGRDSPAP